MDKIKIYELENFFNKTIRNTREKNLSKKNLQILLSKWSAKFLYLIDYILGVIWFAPHL